jgi:hypothetical protein
MHRWLPLAALAAAWAVPARAGFFGPAYVDAGFQHQVERDSDLQGQGYDAGFGLDLGHYFSMGAGYSSVRTEPFKTEDGATGRLEYRSLGGSLGGSLPLFSRGGISAAAGYSFSQTEGLDGFAGDPPQRAEGPTGSIGLHYALVRWVDVSVGRGYSFIGGERSWDTSIGASLLAWRGLWLDGSYWFTDHAEGWSAGLRMRFG